MRSEVSWPRSTACLLLVITMMSLLSTGTRSPVRERGLCQIVISTWPALLCSPVNADRLGDARGDARDLGVGRRSADGRSPSTGGFFRRARSAFGRERIVRRHAVPPRDLRRRKEWLPSARWGGDRAGRDLRRVVQDAASLVALPAIRRAGPGLCLSRDGIVVVLPVVRPRLRANQSLRIGLVGP